jgi:hypothetical protein
VNLPPMTRGHATAVAKAINAGFSENSPRYWMAVENDYELAPGFEP